MLFLLNGRLGAKLVASAKQIAQECGGLCMPKMKDNHGIITERNVGSS